MKSMTGTGLVAVLIVCLAGCGGSSSPETAASAPERAGQAGAPPAARPVGAEQHPGSTGDSPSATVAAFYDALRSGDQAAIARLLTDKAKTETANSGLGIQSQGSANLEYELGEVDYITEEMDGAHVKSLWIDYDEDGQPLATEVIWVLRKQPEGWRVAGMATHVLEGQLPLLFNFEDPEDMLQKKEYIESHFAEDFSAAEPPAQQADAAPADPLVR